MDIELTTFRLSPKNQVTLLKGVRALATAEADGYVWVKPDKQRGPDGTVHPLLVVMTEAEKERRDQALRDDPSLTPAQKQHLIMLFNGGMARLNLDGQRRVVLPASLVKYLGLTGEVYMFSTNTAVMMWNPEAWRRYVDASVGEGGQDGASPSLLMV